MYQGKKQQFDWTFSLALNDLVVVGLSYPLVTLLVSPEEMPPINVSVVYALLIFFCMQKLGLYTWRAFTRPLHTARKVGAALALSVGVLVFCRFLFSGQAPWAHLSGLLTHAAALGILLVLTRVLLGHLLMNVFDLVPKERIAFVGWSPRLDRVLKTLAREIGRFQSIVGFFYDAPHAIGDPAAKNGYTPLSSLRQIERSLVENTVSLLIVDESCMNPQQLQKIGEICARCFVNLKIIPNSFDVWSSRLNLRMVNGVPLLGVYDLRYDRFHNRLAKRALDIACSLLGLAVSAPLIALLAVLIRRESPGPVFFRQVRLGLYGKPFEIYKLRSMRIDSEVDGRAAWTVENDPRRLTIGTFMRQWNLDELPQFWNVLRGDMSMVGPRPERPEFVSGFKETIRYYNLRHSCKPGITGWAAVHGLRGDTSLEDRLEYDLFYIENWSIFLDIRIMLMTLAPPKNAY